MYVNYSKKLGLVELERISIRMYEYSGRKLQDYAAGSLA